VTHSPQANPLTRFLLFRGGAGFRERLLGDPLFLNKLAIEVGVGVVTKLTAEATKRGDNFWREGDFVTANVCMAVIADWMLTWLPAPLLSLSPRPAAAASAAARFWAGVPANAFQTVAGGAARFSPVQRLAAVVRNGAKLFVVGTAASALGTGATNASIALRRVLDPGRPQVGEDMDVARQSLTYGAYMSVSSNLRYQLVAGVAEQRSAFAPGRYARCARSLSPTSPGAAAAPLAGRVHRSILPGSDGQYVHWLAPLGRLFAPLWPAEGQGGGGGAAAAAACRRQGQEAALSAVCLCCVKRLRPASSLGSPLLSLWDGERRPAHEQGSESGHLRVLRGRESGHSTVHVPGLGVAPLRSRRVCALLPRQGGRKAVRAAEDVASAGHVRHVRARVALQGKYDVGQE